MGGVNYWADPDRAVNTEGAGGGGQLPLQVLAYQYILFQPGGQIMPSTLLLALPDFRTFLGLWTVAIRQNFTSACYFFKLEKWQVCRIMYGIFLLSKNFSKYLRKKIVYLSCKHTIELPTTYFHNFSESAKKELSIITSHSLFAISFFLF